MPTAKFKYPSWTKEDERENFVQAQMDQIWYDTYYVDGYAKEMKSHDDREKQFRQQAKKKHFTQAEIHNFLQREGQSQWRSTLCLKS